MAETQSKTTKALTAFDLIPCIIDPAIWQRFDLDSITSLHTRECIGNTKSAVKCTKKVTRDNRLKTRIGTQVAALEKLNPETFPDKSCEQIKQLFHDLLCCHHREEPKAAVTARFKKASGLNSDAEPSPSLQPKTKQHNTRGNLTTETSSLAQHSPSLHKPALARYDPQEHHGLSTSDIIRRCLSKEWAIAKKGSLYGFSTGNVPGHLKLGRTYGSVDQRVVEWEKKCKQSIKLEIQTPTEVPFIWAGEALVHAELSTCRIRFEEPCVCHRRHKEFFQTSKHHAQAVMFKFWAFLKENPYEQSELSNKWMLREEFRRNEALLHFLTTPLSTAEDHDPEAVAAQVGALVAAARASYKAARKAQVAREEQHASARAAALRAKVAHAADKAEAEIAKKADAQAAAFFRQADPVLRLAIMRFAALEQQKQQSQRRAMSVPVACPLRMGTGLSSLGAKGGAMAQAVAV